MLASTYRKDTEPVTHYFYWLYNKYITNQCRCQSKVVFFKTFYTAKIKPGDWNMAKNRKIKK